MKVLFSLISIVCIAPFLSAQSATVIKGDVKIQDDEATASVREGNLSVQGSLSVGPDSAASPGGPYKSNIALGTDTSSTGNNSIAIGSYVRSTGHNSVGIGDYINSYSYNSIAIGEQCTVEPQSAHAFGTGIYIYTGSPYSYAFGHQISLENSKYSFAFGRDIQMLWQSDFVMAIGFGIRSGDWFNYRSEPPYRILMGMYNDNLEFVDIEEDDMQPLLVVGNGKNDTSRSNTFFIRKNGDTTIKGNTEIHGQLTVKKAGGGIPMGQFGLSE